MKKIADLSDLLPAVALPALGLYMGERFGGNPGKLIGGITGGVGGQLIRESMINARAPKQPSIPPGAPYAIDPSAQDIPPWALGGAHILRQQQQMKMQQEQMQQQQLLMQQNTQAAASPQKVATGDSTADVIGGDALGLGWPIAKGIHDKEDAKTIAGTVAGQGLGLAGGGLVGHGLGHAIDHLAGHSVNIPGLNMPLSTLLSGVGATIGSVKGMDLARGFMKR